MGVDASELAQSRTIPKVRLGGAGSKLQTPLTSGFLRLPNSLPFVRADPLWDIVHAILYSAPHIRDLALYIVRRSSFMFVQSRIPARLSSETIGSFRISILRNRIDKPPISVLRGGCIFGFMNAFLRQ
jgi:hypothetical protein